ncbi:MFS transporter, partial [Xanthomonas sp. Kuri4-1]
MLAPRYRAATVGMVALVSLGAFEALAVAAAMPTVARELDGLRLYALAFGGTLATSVVGMTLAGHWSDRAGADAAAVAGPGLLR